MRHVLAQFGAPHKREQPQEGWQRVAVRDCSLYLLREAKRIDQALPSRSVPGVEDQLEWSDEHWESHGYPCGAAGHSGSRFALPLPAIFLKT